MAKPLTTPQYDAVRELLAQQLSPRDVAARAGCSVQTVRNIIHGRLKRPPSEKPGIRHYRGQQFRQVAEYECTGCHLRVVSRPCLICFLRAERNRSRVANGLSPL